MKKIKTGALILFCLLSTLLHSCREAAPPEPEPRPADLLPEASQAGRQTFGCLIDGEVFVPKRAGLFGSPDRSSSFQLLEDAEGGFYYNFQVYADNDEDNIRVMLNLRFELGRRELESGKTYELSEYGNPCGAGTYVRGEAVDTDKTRKGTVTITRHDYDQQIVSGLFSFEVEDAGKVIKITDGRFDMIYTR